MLLFILSTDLVNTNSDLLNVSLTNLCEGLTIPHISDVQPSAVLSPDNHIEDIVSPLPSESDRIVEDNFLSPSYPDQSNEPCLDGISSNVQTEDLALAAAMSKSKYDTFSHLVVL